MRVTILGCGGSSGVPTVGNQWGACDPNNPKNRRLRVSVLVEENPGEDDGVGVLIDTSPDLRQQLLAAAVQRLDGVIWTHHHADHAHGLDELREICRLMQKPLNVYGMAEHLDEIEKRFDYAFAPLKPGTPLYRPVLIPHAVDRPVMGPFDIAGLRVTPFAQDHGYMPTLGLRFGGFAYSTDVVRLDEAAFAALEGIDVWVVDCVRIEPPHPVHSHLAQTLEWIARVKPKRAYLTHMSQSMDYDTVRRLLPPGVEPAYDGLVIDL